MQVFCTASHLVGPQDEALLGVLSSDDPCLGGLPGSPDEVDAVDGSAEVVVEAASVDGPLKTAHGAMLDLEVPVAENELGEVVREIFDLVVLGRWSDQDDVATDQRLHAQQRVMEPDQLGRPLVDRGAWVSPAGVDDQHHLWCVQSDGVDEAVDGAAVVADAVVGCSVDRELRILRDVNACNHRGGRLSLVGVVPCQGWQGSSARERGAKGMHG